MKHIACLFCIYLLAACSTYAEPLQYYEFDNECCEEEQKYVFETLNLEQYKFADQNISHKGIGIILHDLNNDGLQDFLSLGGSTVLCGSRGCNFNIFVNEGNGYRQIRGPSVTYHFIKISERTSHGFKDIIFAGKDNENCTWKFNGQEYELYVCFGIIHK